MTNAQQTQRYWDQVHDANSESFTDALLRMKHSQQWRYIENAIRLKYGSIKDVRSIEIGSVMRSC